MRFLLQLLGLLVIALALGFGLSYYALGEGVLFGATRIGPWVAWPGMGAASPDPYTKAYLVRSGALPLGQGEGLVFTASTDGAGRPLDRNCRYRIGGTTPAAGFWTLEAASLDGRDIAAPDGQLALQSRTIARRNDGSLMISVSRSLAPDDWLQITGSGAFKLVLTLYNPSDISEAGLTPDNLPTITRGACGS